MHSRQVLITDEEIENLRNLVSQLNTKKDSVIVVEGKKDSQALKNLGVSVKILEFYRFGGIIKFADAMARHKNIIIFFDRDRKGKHLTRKTIQLLQRRTKIDLSYKRKLCSITKGKIMFMEQLSIYEHYIN